MKVAFTPKTIGNQLNNPSLTKSSAPQKARKNPPTPASQLLFNSILINNNHE